MSEIISYTQMRNEFYKRFTKDILPVLRKYEKERKKKYKKAVFLIVLYSVLTFVQIILPFILIKINSDLATVMSSGSSDVLLKGGLFTFGLAITTYPYMKKSFENKIKNIIMPTVVSLFENLNWEVGGYSDGLIYEFVQVVPQHDTWCYDDIFRGEHDGVKFEVSESKFYKELFPEHTDRNGNLQANMWKVFQGIVIKLEMNKNFSGHTLIKPNTLLHNPPMEYLNRTILESSEFENKYDVFTTDEVEARYLITPSFMNRLNNIEIAFKAKDLSCGFYYNHLFLSLKTNCDLFSIASLHRPIDDTKQYFQMYEEIVSIIKLIDHFKLDQKIGL